MKRRPLLSVVTALLLVTAGCSSLGGPGGSPTDGPTTTTSADDLPAASDVKADALAASQAVETYRMNATVNQTRVVYINATDLTFINATNFTRVTETTRTWQTNKPVRAAFDRADRRFRINRTIWRGISETVRNQTTEIETVQRTGTRVESEYFVDGTLYQYSPNASEQSNATWSTGTLPPGYWDATDTLAHQRAVLNASDVRLTGTVTVDGVETYVLRANASDAGVVVPRLKGGPVPADNPNVIVHRGWFRFYVATDSGRLVRSDTTLNVTFNPARDEGTSRVDRTTTLRFDYGGNVTITPPEAGNATSIEPTSS